MCLSRAYNIDTMEHTYATEYLDNVHASIAPDEEKTPGEIEAQTQAMRIINESQNRGIGMGDLFRFSLFTILIEERGGFSRDQIKECRVLLQSHCIETNIAMDDGSINRLIREMKTHLGIPQ